MPVHGPCHDAWWLLINRDGMGNHLVACPFEVVDGHAGATNQFPLQTTGLVVHLVPA
jgi:hypothetical protein